MSTDLSRIIGWYAAKTLRFESLVAIKQNNEVTVLPIQKRNWKPVTSGRIYQLYLDVMNRAKELKLWKVTRGLPPLYLRKSSRSVGEYVWKKLPNGIMEDAIVLNKALLNVSDDAVRSVIVHEVAHAIRPRDKHNANWARLANMLGDKWGYKASVYDHDESILQAIAQLKSQKPA